MSLLKIASVLGLKSILCFFRQWGCKVPFSLGRASSCCLYLDDIYPSAQHVGALAYHKLQQKVFADLASFELLCLRQYLACRLVSDWGLSRARLFVFFYVVLLAYLGFKNDPQIYKNAKK